MEPRLDGIKNGIVRIDQEVFGLDIADYVDKSQFEDRYLTQQFKDEYEYPLRSFLFQPINGVLLSLQISSNRSQIILLKFFNLYCISELHLRKQ